MVVEMVRITPPVGFNRFMLRSTAGRDIMQVTEVAMPFFFLMVPGIVVITVFPEILTFLPKLMISRRVRRRTSTRGAPSGCASGERCRRGGRTRRTRWSARAG